MFQTNSDDIFLHARARRPGCGTSRTVPENSDAAAATHGFWDMKSNYRKHKKTHFKHVRVSSSLVFFTRIYMRVSYIFKEIHTPGL